MRVILIAMRTVAIACACALGGCSLYLGHDSPPPAPDAPPPPDASPPQPTARCGDGVRSPGEMCFGTPAIFHAGGPVQSARLFDLDGDHVLDIVYAGLDRVEFRRGDGHGGFGAVESGPLVAAQFVTAGDFDRDGVLDLATAGPDALSLWHGLGDATYAPWATLPLASPAIGLDAGDFEALGVDEIAIATASDLRELRIADGALATIGTSDLRLDALRTGYVDDFGRAQVLGLYQYNPMVFGGWPQGQETTHEYLVYGGGMDVAAGDFDGSGQIGLATAMTPSTISIWSNFEIEVGIAMQPSLIGTADFDRDSRDDVVVYVPKTTSLNIFRSNEYGAPTATSLAFALPEPATLVRVDGDVNGDGVPDPVITLQDAIVVLESAPQ